MLSAFVSAQVAVEKIELEGDVYTVCKNFPKQILGLYKYQGKGDPIVELLADGTGTFQRHDVAADAINFWVDCDEKGVVREYGTAPYIRYTILYQYINDGVYGIKAGTYGLMEASMRPDLGLVIILGERHKALN